MYRPLNIGRGKWKQCIEEEECVDEEKESDDEECDVEEEEEAFERIMNEIYEEEKELPRNPTAERDVFYKQMMIIGGIAAYLTAIFFFSR